MASTLREKKIKMSVG